MKIKHLAILGIAASTTMIGCNNKLSNSLQLKSLVGGLTAAVFSHTQHENDQYVTFCISFNIDKDKTFTLKNSDFKYRFDGEDSKNECAGFLTNASETKEGEEIRRYYSSFSADPVEVNSSSPFLYVAMFNPQGQSEKTVVDYYYKDTLLDLDKAVKIVA